MKKRKKICILGSTGSIGTQALQVIEEHPDLYEAYVLTANRRADMLIEQAKKYQPAAVVIADESKYEQVRDALEHDPIQVYTGSDALCQVVQMDPIDIVLTALVGFSGLRPTISAIKAHKAIALANKETLVVAGELVTDLCLKERAPILPVDSEHSAIFQSLMGETSPVEKIILTASGGPFRTFSKEQLSTVTPAMALKHPNWDMGAKITIDSASMMNKGFEIIEAKWLFDVAPEQIQVVVHPQSIIHSAVQFSDGAVKAQLGVPDMRVPIQLALSYPERISSSFPRLDWWQMQELTFEKPDEEKFRCLHMAYEAIRQGGNAPCILNAANEVVNLAFRQERCSFLDMADIIEHCLTHVPHQESPSLDDYLAIDAETRRIAEEAVSQKGK
ncbi:MAG: 1-deoxy-D-xylulose-5-phosphate reductoisomerase [Paraprevotella sp.]|nr:1-deoxy-D-xylulose-5-phosphate reductoisomerase [Paraprevotella sp.]MDD6758037.1 1-deoxy-D-xylulose-5-phosphate reductoisomerase [Paraprevotella sp.]MDD6821860.1 1-deoxy-D-xylulose-5-phosphate reductoisomerase [Paraprevotella sp.]MDD6822843.1 1-deoxy-D-xylulose-5-phosphate reductoisomerase [Paraprevotella sp.]MDY3098153.1 1-deoxy-D-xylulose-5-phosphate reductoisomerase [Bacteroidaceae bacterium]